MKTKPAITRSFYHHTRGIGRLPQENNEGRREKCIEVVNCISRSSRHDALRSAREETRHIIGSGNPDVIIGSDKDQNRGCRKKDKDHVEFLCELYDAQTACGRYFVRELTSEVNSRLWCVANIMVIPRTRTTAADLCMFGLAACDGGPGVVRCTDGHQREASWNADVK